ncbi:hypothetical protein [Roseivirga sp. E12]|uniref:hypothetical protein n=1 Tax=Roseivirga sp. E12 TaxID=2819237 RepID=UPI001ABCB878|nr:hypothetical protein [Roseivirga sp. E12]MBO3700246.1 hypothetical protein [Roseivirga sp. E12]
MILYLYLQIKPLQNIKFGSDLTKALGNFSSEITSIDLDSHSESFVITKAIEVIPIVEKLVLHLDVTDDEPSIGNISMVFETLRRSRRPLICIIEGNHPNIDKILKLSGIIPHDVTSKELTIELVTDFLTTQS